MIRSSLTTAQVRMILRIYWTDRYQRQRAGIPGVRPGIRIRLAKQFGVSVEVIKKILSMPQNQYGQKRRERFPSIAIHTLKKTIKARLRQQPYGE